VSTDYLVIVKQDKTAHFEISYQIILLLNSKHESVSYLKCLFTSCVLKMLAFCTDTHCQLMSPLINSDVNNVLLQIFPDVLCKKLEVTLQGVG